MTKLKFCRECKWSKPEERSTWNLRCINPSVNAKDPWSLSSAFISGTDCQKERATTWFAICGKSGKQWQKNNSFVSEA